MSQFQETKMRKFRLVLITVLCAGLVVSCNDPLVVIPGRALSGEVKSAPVLWNDVPDTIQVETRPSDPYSVNIWGVGVDDNLYVSTGEDGTRWTPFIEADPNVRVRINTFIYELTASVVTDSGERDRVTEAYIEKYDMDADDNWMTTGIIFRLDRRSQ